MPATTTSTEFLGRTVAVRADWADGSRAVLHLVNGRWVPTPWLVAEVDDCRAALRLELGAMARAIGKDPVNLRQEIISALQRAESK